ncbi:diacylglycerol O-acyltransferase 1 [Tanacetum coccineum]
MALLDTPEIAEPRAEIRRRTTVKTETGDGLYNDSMTSSSSNGESDSNNKENESNESDKEQIGAREDKKKKMTSSSRVHYAYRPSTPAHRRIKESPLSSDAIFKQSVMHVEFELVNRSHAGLFNLCIVVLVAVNSRLIIENLMKYGLLINSNFWFSSRSLRDWPLLMCCLTLLLFPLAAYLVEKMAWKKRLSDFVVITLHLVITTSAILYPVFMILRSVCIFLCKLVHVRFVLVAKLSDLYPWLT